MKPDEDSDAHLGPEAVALVDLARRSLGPMSLQQRSHGLARFSSRIAKGEGVRVSRWAVAALGLGVAAAVAFAGVNRLRAPSHQALSYTVDGAAHAPGDAESNGLVRFSDGTEIQIGKGAHAHVASVTEYGAAVLLDQGEVHARVVHWAGSRWLFDAGPFVVTVTGTTFSLSWTPDEERFDLRLENGSIAVSGPTSDQPIALRSGQWLTIRLRQREVLIRDLKAVDDAPVALGSSSPESRNPLPPAPAHEPAGAESPLDPRGLPSAEPSAAPEPPLVKRDWTGKLAAGKLEEIVGEAEHWGLDSCFAEATNGELSALADAARYTKRGGLAKRALLAQRQRFGGSRRAVEAAFLLGRLAESQEGPATALSWFEKYLTEAPGGAYASEALGRRMTLMEKTAGREQASVVAQEYLLRFPNGTYAGAAQALLRTP